MIFGSQTSGQFSSHIYFHVAA
uniref:Uncharacterized protein n=1 Tax=Arundo donax TaxID=35708 RepID=A0A0A8YS25_ARUDO